MLITFDKYVPYKYVKYKKGRIIIFTETLVILPKKDPIFETKMIQDLFTLK